MHRLSELYKQRVYFVDVLKRLRVLRREEDDAVCKISREIKRASREELQISAEERQILRLYEGVRVDGSIMHEGMVWLSNEAIKSNLASFECLRKSIGASSTATNGFQQQRLEAELSAFFSRQMSLRHAIQKIMEDTQNERSLLELATLLIGFSKELLAEELYKSLSLSKAAVKPEATEELKETQDGGEAQFSSPSSSPSSQQSSKKQSTDWIKLLQGKTTNPLPKEKANSSKNKPEQLRSPSNAKKSIEKDKKRLWEDNLQESQCSEDGDDLEQETPDEATTTGAAGSDDSSSEILSAFSGSFIDWRSFRRASAEGQRNKEAMKAKKYWLLEKAYQSLLKNNLRISAFIKAFFLACKQRQTAAAATTLVTNQLKKILMKGKSFNRVLVQSPSRCATPTATVVSRGEINVTAADTNRLPSTKITNRPVSPLFLWRKTSSGLKQKTTAVTAAAAAARGQSELLSSSGGGQEWEDKSVVASWSYSFDFTQTALRTTTTIAFPSPQPPKERYGKQGSGLYLRPPSSMYRGGGQLITHYQSSSSPTARSFYFPSPRNKLGSPQRKVGDSGEPPRSEEQRQMIDENFRASKAVKNNWKVVRVGAAVSCFKGSTDSSSSTSPQSQTIAASAAAIQVKALQLDEVILYSNRQSWSPMRAAVVSPR